MKCPLCDSESNEIIKSKGKTTREILLKCNECGNTFRETVTIPKMVECRIIISKFEDSQKKNLKLYPDEVLGVGDVLLVEDEEVKVTSLENNRGGRVLRSEVSLLETIWASSLTGQVRVGISVDFGGRILSRKVEIERDFQFTVGDVVKMGKTLFRIKSMKTIDAKVRKGSSRAEDTKRVYGQPHSRENFQYDLSRRVV
ncbi:MAG: HVO_0476 family zinc finger protein [Methanobacteriaceae archaeon]